MQVQSILLAILCASLAASLPTPVPGNVFSAPSFPNIEFNTPNSGTVWTCGDRATIDLTIHNYEGHILESKPKLFLYLHTSDNSHPKRKKFAEKSIEKYFVGPATQTVDHSNIQSGRYVWTVPKRLKTGVYFVSLKLKYWTYDNSLRSGELKTVATRRSERFSIICNRQRKWPWVSWFTW